MRPVLFEVLGQSVHSYSLLVAIATAAGVVVGMALGRRDGRSWRDMVDLAIVAVVGGLLGAKVFHTLFEAAGHHLTDGGIATGVVDLLEDDPWHWARLFEAGYVFYGAVVGAFLIGWLFMVRRALPDKWSVGDYATPSLLIGVLIGRIGCFLGGCCYGRATDVPWAVTFPHGHAAAGIPVHPVQLYDAAFGLIGLVAVALLYNRRRFGGEALCAFFFCYAIYRFSTELFRADADRGVWLGGSLSTSQLVALATVPVSLYAWRRGLRLVRAGKLRRPSEPLPPEDPR